MSHSEERTSPGWPYWLVVLFVLPALLPYTMALAYEWIAWYPAETGESLVPRWGEDTALAIVIPVAIMLGTAAIALLVTRRVADRGLRIRWTVGGVVLVAALLVPYAMLEFAIAVANCDGCLS